MDLLRGLTAPAWLVGLARGVLEGAVFGGIAVAYAFLTSTELPAGLLPFAPLGLAALRFVEGYADHIDPDKVRARQ